MNWNGDADGMGPRDPTVETFIEHWASLPREGDAILPHLRTFLDHPHPRIQPFVALIDVANATTLRLRLFGTRRSGHVGSDLTGIDPLTAFALELRHETALVAHAAATHPCGIRSRRMASSKSGRFYKLSAATLPLATDPGKLPVIANVHIFDDNIAEDDHTPQVSRVWDARWIDIGAGTPDFIPYGGVTAQSA